MINMEKKKHTIIYDEAGYIDFIKFEKCPKIKFENGTMIIGKEKAK